MKTYLAGIAAFLALAAPLLAQGKDFLGTNEFIKDGQALVAPNRSFHLVQQGDGNLCVYRGEPGNVRPGGPLWCSMRKSTGPPVDAACMAAANFRACIGSTRSSLSAAIMSRAG